jgi:hypothetical protein
MIIPFYHCDTTGLITGRSELDAGLEEIVSSYPKTASS